MKPTNPTLPRAFLLLSSIGLVPIALLYGAMPGVTLDMLFGISVETTNLTHIFRAVMGLYLGMAILWFMGALKPGLTGPALISCAVFMFGLAGGRILSLLVDGQPHGLLIFYTGLEIAFGIIALYLFRAE